jgi:hypothetical protein
MVERGGSRVKQSAKQNIGPPQENPSILDRSALPQLCRTHNEVSYMTSNFVCRGDRPLQSIVSRVSRSLGLDAFGCQPYSRGRHLKRALNVTCHMLSQLR